VTLIKSQPLTPELSAKLFAQKGIVAFQFLAALIEWSQSELKGLQKIWAQVYKNTFHIPWSSHTMKTPAKLGAGVDNELGGSAPHQCR